MYCRNTSEKEKCLLFGFSDADYARDIETRRSMSGIAIFYVLSSSMESNEAKISSSIDDGVGICSWVPTS